MRDSDGWKWGVVAQVDKFDADAVRWAIKQGKVHTFIEDKRTPLNVLKAVRQRQVTLRDALSRDYTPGLWAPAHELIAAGVKPSETVLMPGNLLCTAGVTRIWNLVTNQGATQAYDATHTRVGVGNTGNAAGTEAAGDTDLAAAAGSTNRQFKLVGGVGTVSTNSLSFTATFSTAQANFAWTEWGIDQGTADGTTVVAPLLNHKIVSGGLGTKTSAASWAFTVTISLT